MAALIARHDVEPLCEQIDNFALAFVAPLGANNCDNHGQKLEARKTRQLRLNTKQARLCQ